MPDENEEVQVNIARIMIPKVSVAAVHADDTVRQGLEIMKYHRYTSIRCWTPRTYTSAA